MKKAVWIFLIGVLLISFFGINDLALAQRRIPPGRVAMHLVGWQYYYPPPDITREGIGYFSFIDQIPGPLLIGDKAYFTFRTEPLPEPEAGEIFSPPFDWLQSPSFLIYVYYNENPALIDSCSPEAFSDGQLIGTFRTASAQFIYRRIAATASPRIIVRIMFSAELESSRSFVFIDGRTYSLRRLVPSGVTFTLLGHDYVQDCGDGDLFQEVGGSALAIGGIYRRFR